MPSPYDVYIKSARPLVISPADAPFDRALRLGQNLIKTHTALIEHLPVLADLARKQGSEGGCLSLSPILKYQSCFSQEGLELALGFVYGAETFVKPRLVTDILAAGIVLRIEELIGQVESELLRLAKYDESILFALEHAVLNMTEQSEVREQIVEVAVSQLSNISVHGKYGVILWPTFEMLMRKADACAPPVDVMHAFINWVDHNRHDQTRACSLLLSFSIHGLSASDRSMFAKRAASLSLHGVSEAMSKLLAGSTPRTLTHRWSTCSDLSVSSSVDVIAIHESPFTSVCVDSSQLGSEYSSDLLHSELDASLMEEAEMGEEEEEEESCYDDYIQEEACRMGAGADAPEDSSSSLSPSTADSSSFIVNTKMVDFGTIPIPDGDVKNINLSVEFNDTEAALDYIRKIRFHFDMEVDPRQ